MSRKIAVVAHNRETDYLEQVVNLCKEYFLADEILTFGYNSKSDSQEKLLHSIVKDKSIKIVILLCNNLQLIADNIGEIRRTRKDIFLSLVKIYECLLFDSNEKLYQMGISYCKKYSCNLVLMSDIKHSKHMVVAPEEAHYSSPSFEEALLNLIQMTALRSALTFTRSTLVEGELVGWQSEQVPSSLRTVVDYCIAKGAYKPINGVTAGHFAVKVNDNTFLTSVRRTNFNKLHENGLVRVEAKGNDEVIAYGAKPSVGGQRQRIVFRDHPEYDCIVHFHSPKRYGSKVPVRSQREVECGSHQCGENTSQGLKKFGNLAAVYLDNHGPNIVFNRSIDPQEVINFIEDNFDLTRKTDEFYNYGERNRLSYEEVQLTEEQAEFIRNLPKFEGPVPQRLPEADPSTLF